MVPTPAQVLPLFDPLAAAAHEAIEHGIGFADDLLDYGSDPWYWSHSARFAVRNRLAMALQGVDRWTIRTGVPNSGIHLMLDNAHRVRVVKSLNQDVPHPGRNRARQLAWFNDDIATLGLTWGPHNLPALNLVVDWHVSDGQPVVHVALPRESWKYGAPTKVHWRQPLSLGGSAALEDLRFEGTDDGDPLIIEHSEAGTG